MKATSYINDAIIKKSLINKFYVPYVDIIMVYAIGSVAILSEISMWYGLNVMWGGITSITSAC